MNPSSVSFAGTLNESQFNRVQGALLPIWMRWYVFAPSVLICFVQIGSGLVGAWKTPSLAIPDLLLGLAVIAVCALIVKLGRRRAWKTYLRLHGSVSGQLSVEGFQWKTEASTTSLPWSKLTGHRVLEDLALLYYAPRCAFFLPRTFFSSEQDWASLKQFLGEYSKPV